MKERILKPAALTTIVIIIFTSIGCQNLYLSHASPQRQVISLAGQWRFKLDPNNLGIDRQWFNTELPDRIKLPGSTAENGFGRDVSIDTKWTGSIIDKSWFTDPRYEKYRRPPNVKVPFWLTPVKHYVGPAWYQKQVSIPKRFAGKRITLFLERCHWETKLWLDGAPAGMQDSLSTPHLYDLTGLLTPGKHILTIRVDNSIKYNVGQNAHSVSDHTQSNWNGIVGRIELQATDKIYIEDIQIYPDIKNNLAKAHITIISTEDMPLNCTLIAEASGHNYERVVNLDPYIAELTFRKGVPKGVSILELEYPMGNEAFLWDEFSPATYIMHVSIEAKGPTALLQDHKSVRFGMRKFATKGTQFTINDRPTFLRGTLECSIFPRTGYPAMDVAEWIRILRAAKAHGLNHLRFHSWCPPEAAFDAADHLGIMFHVECPAWAAIGDGKPIDKFIYDEGDRILKHYGNHPSFCMLAYGNEPGGKNQKRWLGDLVNYWKKKDPRRLYTSAAGWPIIPESDYHSTPRPRGHQWGAGLKSRFNANPPETLTDYSGFIQQYDVPVVSHEIGQWCVYPNFKEIPKYTGVLKARNFEIFRDSLAAHHMLDQADDFLIASGKLQALLYKQEIETALRTPGFGGFQLLDIHDFPGQGTALVGILDPFWDSKGYITAEEHHRYCGETVPLLRMAKRTWTTDETFTADIEIAHFGPAPIENATVTWSVHDSDGYIMAGDKLPPRTIPIGSGIKLGTIEWALANVKAPTRLSVKGAIWETSYENDWDIWVYPSHLDTKPPEDILIADSLDDRTISALNAGKKVLLTPPPERVNSDIPPGFTTIFWNTAWTRKQPPHTLGLLCNPKHPALAEFPTQFHSNWQWWDLVTKSRFMLLDEFPPALRPIVQVIDDWTTNRKLAIIFEAEVASGRLLVCSIDLRTNLEKRPAARQMLHSLLNYMNSSDFAPAQSADIELIRGLFRKPPLLHRAKVIKTDSQAPGHEARNAIDGNPNTIWHTPWQNNPPRYPHELIIELEEPAHVRGIKYLPRQDMSNGWISKYEVYVSDDAEQWGQPAAEGALKKGKAEKKIMFKTPQNARFVRFVALSGFDDQIFAAVAELDLIPAD